MGSAGFGFGLPGRALAVHQQNEHNLMVVNPLIPATTVAEFIAYAKTRPEWITFASPGVGSPAHLQAS